MNHQVFQLIADLALYREGELFLGVQQVRLLRQVERDGSIRTAALSLKMSYQHAWHMVDRINRLSPVPVVVRQKGGKDGGGCSITPFGFKMLHAFEQRFADVVHLLSDLDNELERCFF
jgi:molybdate transport system regulatory protein